MLRNNCVRLIASFVIVVLALPAFESYGQNGPYGTSVGTGHDNDVLNNTEFAPKSTLPFSPTSSFGVKYTGKFKCLGGYMLGWVNTRVQDGGGVDIVQHDSDTGIIAPAAWHTFVHNSSLSNSGLTEAVWFVTSWGRWDPVTGLDVVDCASDEALFLPN